MGDVGDTFNSMRAHKRRLRAKFGIECPACCSLQPKRFASILLPGQKCNIDGYRDPRERLTAKQREEA